MNPPSLTRVALVFFLSALLSGCLPYAYDPPPPDGAEAVTAQYFESVRDDPEELRGFLALLPLGGDLHHHASGAIPAETMIRFAAEEGLCLPSAEDAVWRLTEPPCRAGEIPALAVLEDADLLDEARERWTMRDYLASDPSIDRREAHDHFFGIFGQIDLATDDLGRLLAVGRSEAANQNVIYLETSSGWFADEALARELYDTPWDEDLERFRETLLADPRFAEVVAGTVAAIPGEFEQADEILGCAGDDPDPGCEVEVRLQHIALRVLPPEVVFVQTLLGYEIAAASPYVVAINLVAPETDPVAIRDYALHMRMHATLAPHYPTVMRTLHTAEMTDAEAIALGANNHLALAIAEPEEGGAGVHRVGHGVALDAEATREAVLAKMRDEEIAVELNLRSNLQLLGVEGEAHPILDYLEAGVPIVLSTDDPGIMLTGLREQFEVAASYDEIDYVALKRFVYDSIEYAFLDDGTKSRLEARLDERFREAEAFVAWSLATSDDR